MNEQYSSILERRQMLHRWQLPYHFRALSRVMITLFASVILWIVAVLVLYWLPIIIVDKLIRMW